MRTAVALGAATCIVALVPPLATTPPAHASDSFSVTTTINVTYSSDIAVLGEYAYVASNSTISVLDGVTGAVVDTEATGGIASPRGAAASGSKVFFAAADSNQLVTLDTSTSTVSTLSTSVAGNACSSPFNLLVVSPSRLVANCHGNNAIQVYDISGAPSIVATYATGSSPRLMSSSGDFVFVPNHGASTMSVINISTGVITTVNVGSRPNATAYLDGKVYTADFDSNTSTISDGAAYDQRVAQVTVGSNPQDIAACEGKIFTANRWTGNTSVISATTNAVTNTIPLAGVGGITHVMEAQGQYAYFLNFSSKSVSIVDCVSESVASTLTVADNPNWIALSSSYAYVTLSGNKVAVIAIPQAASGSGSAAAVSTTETLSMFEAEGVVCSSTSVSGQRGQWVVTPPANACQSVLFPGKEVLGWSTVEDFPRDIARRQVRNGWGTYELFTQDGRLTGVFIPAGGSTLLTGSTRLYPILS